MRPTSTPSSSFLFLAPVPLVELSNLGGDYALIYSLLLWVGLRSLLFPTLHSHHFFKRRWDERGVFMESFVFYYRFFKNVWNTGSDPWMHTFRQIEEQEKENKAGKVDNCKILQHLEGRGYFLPN